MNKGTRIYDEASVSDIFINASQILYDAVAHTIGPEGLNSAIPTSNGYLSIINDGKTILESLSSDNIAVKLALNTLKESAFATNLNAGDGTTSTTILQHHLLGQIYEYNSKALESGDSPLINSKTVLNAMNILLENLPKLKKDISSKEDLLKVITVSLGSPELAQIVLDAFDGLNKDQVPSLIKTNNSSITSTISIDGISLSPIEVNPVVLKSMPLSGNEPLNVIIIKQQLSRIDKPFSSLLQKMANSSNKTILIYTEMMPSILDQILFNIQEGSLNIIPVRLACSVEKLDDIIEEMSKYFNLTPINDLHPYQVYYSDPSIFGKATGYVLNKDSIIIKNDNPEYQSSILPSKSTAIQVGFITYSKQDETFRRLEDAIHSAYNAINYGYTLGAGYSYYTLATYLPNDKEYAPIKFALQFMFNYLLDNHESSQKFIDYITDNVFDSYKVTEQVILNAFTVISQVLSTNCILVPIK